MVFLVNMELNNKVEASLNINGSILNKEPLDGLQIKTDMESCDSTLAKTSVKEKADKTLDKSSNNAFEDTFKKPEFIIRPRKDLPSKIGTVCSIIPDEAVTDSKTQSNSTKKDISDTTNKTDKSESVTDCQKDRQLSFPYIEPLWSGIPEEHYKLEVLKSGVILETVDLSKKSYHVVGRLPSCDISMAHPTISRNHAILQYRLTADEKNGKGLYVYDLGSTHGTFWNGNRIKPKVYVRVQRGHMVSFGCSQRKFILQAPLDDQEEETDLSYTELKELRRLKLEETERIKEQQLLEQQKEEALRKEKEESDGIDWGMGEDADEETDLTENPYAETNNEELFLEDPKKSLRGWFEREGYDLQYEVEEKGVGKFLCWVNLPIDGNKTVRAEALTSGKKKEAVIQCALEACRILDRYGLLRQANHETRKRKSRNWAEEDYYDSDEDNFLDRTGTIEKKREQRMKIAGKLENKAETYDTLLEKHSKVVDRMTNIENALSLHKAKQDEIDDVQEDALDAFMSKLGSLITDKSEIKKLKLELLNLRKEEVQLLKLINIAKPANLPVLKPHSQDNIRKLKDKVRSSQLTIGQKKSSTHKNTRRESKNERNEEEIDDSLQKREEDNQNTEVMERIQLNNDNTKSTIEDEPNNEADIKKPNNISKKRRTNERKSQQEISISETDSNQTDGFRENYSMWLPPTNQTGDGKTSLNEKFGY